MQPTCKLEMCSSRRLSTFSSMEFMLRRDSFSDVSFSTCRGPERVMALLGVNASKSRGLGELSIG